MANKKLLAGIDAGTTGVTVMIADTEGNIVGTAYREYPCSYPHPGWVEQNMELMWTRMCEASKEVIAKTGVNPEEIASLGFSSQRGTFVCVDKNLKPLADSIVWSCGRAGEELAWIRENLGADRYHDISGVPLSGLWSYAKMKWVVDRRPKLLDKTHLIINGQEFFLHKFGSEDISSDPGIHYLERNDGYRQFGLVQGTVRSHRTAHGKAAAHEDPGATGGSRLKEGLRGLRVCCGHAHLFWRGRPAVRSHRGGRYPGRAGGNHHWDGLGDGGPYRLPKGGSRASRAYGWFGHPGEMGYGRAGLRNGGLPSLVERHLWPGGEAGGGTVGHGRLRYYRAQAASAPVGCKGSIFFPFFSGQVTPHYVDNARGGAIGLSLIHDRAMMARSIMEGGAYELRMIVDAMEKVLGKPFDSIRLSGGGAKSPLWNQIQADVYGRPVERLKVSECTTLGATILGAAGAGVFGSVEEAVGNMVHPFDSIEPNMGNHAIYQDVFGVFKDTFLALRDAGVYDKIAAVQSKHWG